MLKPNISSSETVTRPSLQPMGFIDILDTVFSLYGNHSRLILGICAVYFVLMLGTNLFTGIATFFFQSSGLPGIAIAIRPVATWIAILVALFSAGMLLFVGTQIYLGKHITTGAALRRVTHRFWSYLGSFFLWMLIVGVLAVTIIGIPFAIYFGTRWGFYAQAVLIERTSATNALKRSRALVTGTWWRVFGIMLAIFLFTFTVQIVLQFILLFALGFTEVINAEEGLLKMFQRMLSPELTSWDGLASYIIQNFINEIVTSLILPLTPIGITLLYFDQRIRKEGFGTEIRGTNEME